jgi:ABC-type uncharacterized transport system permease subunit
MNNLTFLAFCLAFACYALAFFLLWRRQTLRAQDVLDADEITDATSAGPALMIALLGLVGHCVVTQNTLIQTGSNSTLTLSLLGVSNLVVGVMLLVVAISSIKVKADSLLLLLLPLVMLNLLGLVAVPAGQTQPIQLDGGQISHILLSISAYAALMTAALQSILIAVQERRLRSLQSGLFGLLPPYGSHGGSIYCNLVAGIRTADSVHCHGHSISSGHVRSAIGAPHGTHQLVLVGLCRLSCRPPFVRMARSYRRTLEPGRFCPAAAWLFGQQIRYRISALVIPINR